jgi:hypothetical protein
MSSVGGSFHTALRTFNLDLNCRPVEAATQHVGDVFALISYMVELKNDGV